VQIFVFDADNQPRSSGSGTIIDQQGDILTNYHVVEPALTTPGYSLLVLMTSTAESVPSIGLNSDIVASDRALDLALLKTTSYFLADRDPAHALGAAPAQGNLVRRGPKRS
jgi:S1-C subfamily serine protease